MMTGLLATGMIGILLLGLIGSLGLAEWAQRRRDTRYARQIALTDAIHCELGAVVAPFVTRRRGEWVVSMRVPFDRPATVAAILSVTERAFASTGYPGDGPYRITLTPAPREPRPASIGVSCPATGKPARLAA